MASFLIEFGAVIVRSQARQQQSDGLVSFGLVSFGQVSFGLVSFGQVSFGQVSFGQVSFGQVSFGQVSFGQFLREIPPHSPGSLKDGRVGLRRAKRKEPRPVAVPSDLYPKT